MGRLSPYSAGVLGRLSGDLLEASIAPIGSWTGVIMMFGIGLGLTAGRLVRYVLGLTVDQLMRRLRGNAGKR